MLEDELAGKKTSRLSKELLQKLEGKKWSITLGKGTGNPRSV